MRTAFLTRPPLGEGPAGRSTWISGVGMFGARTSSAAVARKLVSTFGTGTPVAALDRAGGLSRRVVHHRRQERGHGEQQAVEARSGDHGGDADQHLRGMRAEQLNKRPLGGVFEQQLEGYRSQVSALESRPELTRSTAQISAAVQSRRGAIYGPLIPTIGGQAFAGEFNGGGDVRVNAPTVNSGGPRQDYTVGLSWKFGPGGLFDLGRIRASGAKLSAAQLSDERLRDQISREVVDGYTRVQSLFEQLRVARLN